MTEKKRKRKSAGGRRISFGCVEYTTFVKNEAMTPSKEKERLYSNIEGSPDVTKAEGETKPKEDSSRRFSFGMDKKQEEKSSEREKIETTEDKAEDHLDDTSAFSEFCSSSLLPHQSDDDSILERPSILSSWASQAKANPSLWDSNERKSNGEGILFISNVTFIAIFSHYSY